MKRGTMFETTRPNGVLRIFNHLLRISTLIIIGCPTMNNGLVIGWLALIGNLLLCISSLILFILLCIYNCDDLAAVFEKWSESDLELCGTLRGVIIGLLVVLIVLAIVFALIGWKCIQGTKNRNHFQVKPMMILMGVATVLSALQIGGLTAGTIINGILTVIIDAYLFVVMYSLYNVFRQEYERGGNRLQPHYQIAGKV